MALLAAVLFALAAATPIWQLSSESTPVSFLSADAMPMYIESLSDCAEEVADFTIALWITYDMLPQTNEFFLLNIDQR